MSRPGQTWTPVQHAKFSATKATQARQRAEAAWQAALVKEAHAKAAYQARLDEQAAGASAGTAGDLADAS